MAQASALLAPLSRTPREFVHDPVLLEFLGLPGTGRLPESNLEQGLMNNRRYANFFATEWQVKQPTC